MENSEIWQDIYADTDFGNQYASSYLVTLFHRRVKPQLLMNKKLSEVNVLDFGCSLGANSAIFNKLGINTFGVDVSEKAIEKLIRGGGDAAHFKAANILSEGINIRSLFGDIKFDFIVASECMYYFKNEERNKILDEFYGSMDRQGMLYVNMPTYDTPMYCEYKETSKDSDGMVEIKESGSISKRLSVNLPRNEKEMREMFKPFKAIDLMITDERIYSDKPMIEYHLLAVKGPTESPCK